MCTTAGHCLLPLLHLSESTNATCRSPAKPTITATTTTSATTTATTATGGHAASKTTKATSAIAPPTTITISPQATTPVTTSP